MLLQNGLCGLCYEVVGTCKPRRSSPACCWNFWLGAQLALAVRAGLRPLLDGRERCIWDSSYLGREEGAGKVPKGGILTVGTFVLSQRFHVWSPTFLAMLRKIKVWGKCFTGRTWAVNWGSELCMHVGLGKAGFTGLLLQSCCETNAFFLAHPTLSYKSVIL